MNPASSAEDIMHVGLICKVQIRRWTRISMCCAGTLLSEAARFVRRGVPGWRRRDFGFSEGYAETHSPTWEK